ncbi:MAG: Omp28-related outer membrane protein [Paludibacteraceae bacterium]|nr:Omp28-related outer membrane protein [Paludibacteraceae bacterium]
MKKFLFAIAAMALLASCSSKSNSNNDDPIDDPVLPADTIQCANNAQTIVTYDNTKLEVSTEVTKRNAVIEEYTGINCGYCPEGHKIVNDIMKEYPGQVFGINIHCGGYAANTYTTTEGDAYLRIATDLEGFPAGSINRHTFSGMYALNRGAFKSNSKKIIAMDAPVNLAATAEIEQATRTLTVKVKGFFTTVQELATNSLYVFVLQDNVIGPQGGASGNPEQVVEGGQYRHMHMLRTCITGTWGQEIVPIVGTSFDRTYTYVIPEKLGVKPIDAVLADLKVVVCIAEGQKEILQVIEPEMNLK